MKKKRIMKITSGSDAVEMLPVDQMGEDALGHGAAADVAVAHE